MLVASILQKRSAIEDSRPAIEWLQAVLFPYYVG